jgi:hypothetical protein
MQAAVHCDVLIAGVIYVCWSGKVGVVKESEPPHLRDAKALSVRSLVEVPSCAFAHAGPVKTELWPAMIMGESFGGHRPMLGGLSHFSLHLPQYHLVPCRDLLCSHATDLPSGHPIGAALHCRLMKASDIATRTFSTHQNELFIARRGIVPRVIARRVIARPGIARRFSARPLDARRWIARRLIARRLIARCFIAPRLVAPRWAVRRLIGPRASPVAS